MGAQVGRGAERGAILVDEGGWIAENRARRHELTGGPSHPSSARCPECAGTLVAVGARCMSQNTRMERTLIALCEDCGAYAERCPGQGVGAVSS